MGGGRYISIALQLAAHALSCERARLSTDTDKAGILARVVNLKDDTGRTVACVPFWSTSSESLPTLIYEPTETYDDRLLEGGEYVYGLGSGYIADAYGRDNTMPQIFASFDDGDTPPGLSAKANDILAFVANKLGVSIQGHRVLDAYTLDNVVAETLSAKDYLLSVVLPLLPVSLVPTQGGLRVVSMRQPAVAPTQRIEDDWLDPELTLTTTGRCAHVTVQYGYSVRTGAYVMTVGRSVANASPGSTGRVLTTAAIYDTQTAQRVADDLAAWYGGVVCQQQASNIVLRLGQFVVASGRSMQVIERRVSETESTLTLRGVL